MTLRPYDLRSTPLVKVIEGEKGKKERDPRAKELYIFREFPVYGIDVSKFNGRIKWDKINTTSNPNQHITFMIAKATEGYRLKDYRYNYNVRQAKKKNIKVGAYHFYSPNKDPERQAENFIHQAKLSKGDIIPVLDIEKRGNLPIKEFHRNILTYLEIMESEYGVEPMVYTYTSFYRDYLNNKTIRKYPLWIARYNIKDPIRNRNDWQFWQYSQTGEVEGISENVDLNVFWGNKTELDIYCIH